MRHVSKAWLRGPRGGLMSLAAIVDDTTGTAVEISSFGKSSRAGLDTLDVDELAALIDFATVLRDHAQDLRHDLVMGRADHLITQVEREAKL